MFFHKKKYFFLLKKINKNYFISMIFLEILQISCCVLLQNLGSFLLLVLHLVEFALQFLNLLLLLVAVLRSFALQFLQLQNMHIFRFLQMVDLFIIFIILLFFYDFFYFFIIFIIFLLFLQFLSFLLIKNLFIEVCYLFLANFFLISGCAQFFQHDYLETFDKFNDI